MPCYIDESGQHTHGDFFSVAAVIVKTLETRNSCDHILLEVDSGLTDYVCVLLFGCVCRYGFICIVLVAVGATLIFV